MTSRIIKPFAQNKREDQHIPPIAGSVFSVFLLIAILGAVIGDGMRFPGALIGGWVVLWTFIGVYILFALKVASQWEKAVILRFGRFLKLAGPGFFWIVPIMDNLANWIDHRVMVTPFSAEKTLTKDTVPVDVDAVLFWMVWDAEKAALEVEDYRAAIAWARRCSSAKSWISSPSPRPTSSTSP